VKLGRAFSECVELAHEVAGRDSSSTATLGDFLREALRSRLEV
jgi:hypothetical protein